MHVTMQTHVDVYIYSVHVHVSLYKWDTHIREFQLKITCFLMKTTDLKLNPQILFLYIITIIGNNLLFASEAISSKWSPHLFLLLLFRVTLHHVLQCWLIQVKVVFQVLRICVHACVCVYTFNIVYRHHWQYTINYTGPICVRRMLEKAGHRSCTSWYSLEKSAL